MRATAHRPAHGAIYLVLGLALLGCGEPGRAPGSRSERAHDEAAPWAKRLADPTPATLLEALAQPHSVARDVLGPHRLQYKARFSLAPDEPAPPRVGKPAASAQEVEDALELVWGSNPGEEPRFSISQLNDHDRGRDVIVLDGNAYTRMRNRQWLVRPVESDLADLWLDDAQLAAHDLVELAAPRLHVVSESANVEGTSTVKLDLGMTESVDADLVPPTGWRHDVTIDEVSGRLSLLAESGLWLSAEIVVGYHLRPAEGGVLRGTARLEGKVERIEADAARISAPDRAQPVPERLRYDVERRRLLEGLAAP